MKIAVQQNRRLSPQAPPTDTYKSAQGVAIAATKPATTRNPLLGAYDVEVNFQAIRKPVLTFVAILLLATAPVVFSDMEFPILPGLAVWLLSFFMVLKFFNSPVPYWTSLFTSLVVFFGFPMGLTYMVVKKDDLLYAARAGFILDSFTFSNDEYWRLLSVAFIGMIGLFLAQMCVANIRLPTPTYLKYSGAKSRGRLIRLLMSLSLIVSALSGLASSLAHVGMTGVKANVEIPYLFGFLFRLGVSFVPTLNITIIHQLALQHNSKLLKTWFFFVIVQGITLSLVTASRSILLTNIIIPILYLAISRPIQLGRLVPFRPLVTMTFFVVFLSVFLATAIRPLIYEAVQSGNPIDHVEMLASIDFAEPQKRLEDALTFFNRLLGVRELSWVTSAQSVNGEGWEDIWYGIVVPRDPLNQIHSRLSSFQDRNDDDFAFGTAYMMFATLFIPFAPDLFTGMISVLVGSFLLFMVVWAAERTLLKLGGSYAMTSVFSLVLFMHVWQSGALLDFARRTLLIYGLSLIFLGCIFRYYNSNKERR